MGLPEPAATEIPEVQAVEPMVVPAAAPAETRTPGSAVRAMSATGPLPPASMSAADATRDGVTQVKVQSAMPQGEELISQTASALEGELEELRAASTPTQAQAAAEVGAQQMAEQEVEQFRTKRALAVDEPAGSLPNS